MPVSDSCLFTWFCVRSHVKREHVAAEHLRRLPGVEVFLPRIRFRRQTRRGPAWVTEALFPNYLFARFEWETTLTQVHYAPSVAGVIHFADKWPTLPDPVIEELRRSIGDDQVFVIDTSVGVGDEVQITDGVFQGLKAVTTRIMPARQRVTVLLEFLGRQTAVELPMTAVIKEADQRAIL
jgi:transcriptional antiterminator RfaH